jgi:histidine triad (HIT) family protein
MPKQHHELLTDLPADLLKDVAEIVHRLAPAVVKGTGSEGYNVVVNNKKCAGQAIPHVHFHIIPRKTDDGVRFQWNPKKYPEGELDKTLASIKGSLG